MTIKPPPALNEILERFKTLDISPNPFDGVYDSIIDSLKLENEEDVTAIAIHTGFLLGVICGKCCTQKEFEEFRKQLLQLAIDIKPPQPGVINEDGTIDLDIATRLMNGT